MKTRRFCHKCGRPVVKSNLSKSLNRYSFQCYGCNEDFWKFEVLRVQDMKRIKFLRKNTIEEENKNGGHKHSVYKPYPQCKQL